MDLAAFLNTFKKRSNPPRKWQTAEYWNTPSHVNTQIHLRFLCYSRYTLCSVSRIVFYLIKIRIKIQEVLYFETEKWVYMEKMKTGKIFDGEYSYCLLGCFSPLTLRAAFPIGNGRRVTGNWICSPRLNKVANRKLMGICDASIFKKHDIWFWCL